MLHRNTMRKLILAISLLISLHITAKDYFEERENQINITGSLNSQYAIQFEISYQHRLFRYADLGIGAGILKQWCDAAEVYSGELSYKDYDQWSLNSDDYKIDQLFLRPYIQLYTPEIWHSGKCHFRMSSQAGLMFVLPFESVGITYSESNGNPYNDEYHIHHTSKGQWIVPFVRPMMEMTVENLGFAIGAEFSNLDIYSFRRNIHFHDVSFNNLYEKKRFTWGICLNLSYIL